MVPLLATETYEKLYLEMEKPLFNVVYRWVWSDQEARDLVQEAFVKLWERRDRLQPESARAYVYRTALNLAANRLRFQKLRGLVGVDALTGLLSRSHGETALLSDERERAVRKAVLALPERHRRVLLLCRFAEMSHAEVGKLLGIPEGTVASRDHKARALLRRELAMFEGGSAWT